MGQQPKRGAINRANQRLKRGFSMIETVVMITVIGIVSMMTVSVLYSLTVSNTGLQNENYADLKLQNLMQQIAEELGSAHPAMIEVANNNQQITYRQIIAESEATALDTNTIYDDAVNDIEMLNKNMRVAFAPYGMNAKLYRITKIQNGKLTVKNVKHNFPKTYAIVSAEASIGWQNNAVLLEKQYYSNKTKTYTSGIMCDGVSAFSVRRINVGMVEVTVEMSINSYSYTSTKMIALGVPS